MSQQDELYADSAQARALDRRLSRNQEVHWASKITPEQAVENNRAWLAMIRRQDDLRLEGRRKSIAAALGKMETMCGSGRSQVVA